MNCEAKVLSELIGSIYDTTIDRTLWPEALRKSAEFVGGMAAAIYAKSASANTGHVYHQSTSIPIIRSSISRKLIKLIAAHASPLRQA